jgi:hypothetical protein
MRIRIVVASVATALVMVFLLPGCNSKKENEDPGTEVIEKIYKVNPDASLRIDNPRGSVTIRGTDGSDAQLRAVKSASSATHLKDITVNVTAEPGDIKIKTSFLRQKNQPFFAGGWSVDYTLSVPRSARIARLDVDDGNVSIEGIQNADVSANVVNGRLEVRNCCGDLKVSVANGALDLIYRTCEGPYFSGDAQVLNGNARLSIERGASFRVRAETVNGKIANQLGDTVQLNGAPQRKIDVSVGTSRRRPDIAIHVTSGDITVVSADSE